MAPWWMFWRNDKPPPLQLPINDIPEIPEIHENVADISSRESSDIENNRSIVEIPDDARGSDTVANFSPPPMQRVTANYTQHVRDANIERELEKEREIAKERAREREITRARLRQYLSKTQSIRQKQTSNHKTNEDKIVSYKNISSMIDNMFYSEDCENSMALDIISIYLKGQKILYIEAKTYCEQFLNALMLPAIFLSAASTLLSVQLRSFKYGGTVVASISACNSFILTLISYLKLDAKAEAHKTSSYKYDKLQSLCEFNSGKILFFDNEADSDYVSKIINEIETQVKEIKETNQFILPESIRYRFPILYSTNVFATVKKLQNEEMILTNKYRSTIQKKQAFLEQNCIEPSGRQEDNILINAELARLEDSMNSAFEDLIQYRDKYLEVDYTFNREIASQIALSKKTRFNIFGWLKT